MGRDNLPAAHRFNLLRAILYPSFLRSSQSERQARIDQERSARSGDGCQYLAEQPSRFAGVRKPRQRSELSSEA